MSFRAQLVADALQVEPGSSAAVAVEVTSLGEQQDHVELVVEGLDPEWVAVPVPAFVLEAGQVRTERLFLKPPRESHSAAGSYPFLVRVRSLESGESKSLQGVLEIKQFHHLSVDVQPRKAVVSPFSRETSFQVTVMNLGNSDQTLQLFASDIDDFFTFEFSSEQISLSPGQQKSVSLTAAAAKSSILANSRLQAVSITARSIEFPAVSTSGQAQIEQKALISPGGVAMMFVILLAAILYFSMLPKPPVLLSFQADKMKVMEGDSVTFSWKADDASSVTLLIGDKRIEGLGPASSYTYSVSPDDDGRPVNIWAVKGTQKSRETTLTLHVDRPIVAPLPTVDRFEVKPTQAKLGDALQIYYKLGDSVVEATLSPVGTHLDPRADGVQVKADLAGSFQYKIIASNKDGKKVESSPITVTVIQASKASIVKFDSSSQEIAPGERVTITWQAAGAARLELKINNQAPLTLGEASGTQDIEITETTTLRLIAYDADGRTVDKKIVIKVKPAPSLDDPQTQPPPLEPPVKTTGGGPGGGHGWRTLSRIMKG